MHPKRRNRLLAVTFILLGASATIALVLSALNENLNLFYPPDQVVAGAAPIDTRIRAGGMVKSGSVERDPNSLEVRFVVSDFQGSDFPVRFNGILPDLFREGQGILVQGELQSSGEFAADEVLAKHDENYMPPELAGMAPQNEASAEGEGGG
ncbi:MAG: cytochrome c maturation protein CcmE [Pseudomonadales bacterium]